MNDQQQIEAWIAEQHPRKREEMQWLHRRIVGMSPDCKLRFVSGRNDEGKVVANPSVGYGSQTRRYADGEVREFYRVGVSGNTAGLSVYLLRIEDKTYLARTYGGKLGKAKITGYCISFRRLTDVNVALLEEAIATHLKDCAITPPSAAPPARSARR
jgi:hypothetical protein